jgi:transcriptional regulator with XRE-family HTH domain
MPHSEDHNTDRPGHRLKRARLRLKLTYRDVEQASQKIAGRRDNPEFAIALSRLADIENKGTVPSIYRLYTLTAVYRLNLDEVLRWYGIPRHALAGDALQVGLEQTHAVDLAQRGANAANRLAEGEIDLRTTTFLSHLVKHLGTLPLHLLNNLDLRHHRYGLIGLEDWSMYPVLHPGSLVLIDDHRRKIVVSGWTNEYDRPIYFLEHRDGYCCGWCDLEDSRLILQTHPASHQKPRVFAFPSEIEVVGRVVGVAMALASGTRRTARSATAPSPSPGQ